MKVELELEDEDRLVIAEYGIVAGMNYEQQSEWTYLLRWAQSELSAWMVAADGTSFFAEWEIKPL